MDEKEILEVIDEIRAQVKAKPENKEKTDEEIDEMILDAFFKAYTEGEITKEDLGGIAQAMGYEFSEDFDKEAPENAENPTGADTPGVTAEDLEEVRNIEPGESTEEFKEKIEDVRSGEGVEEEEDEDEDEEEVDDDDEDAQREKASKLFKTDLTKKN